jgi:hypothetical protein
LPKIELIFFGNFKSIWAKRQEKSRIYQYIRHLVQPLLRARVRALARKKFFVAIQFFSINLLFQRIYWSCMQKYELQMDRKGRE